MRIEEIIKIMESIAPLSLAADWDNCGIQIHVGKTDIRKVMTALEISKEVICEAKEKNVDMIITHHPLIFRAIENIDNNTVTGKHIIELINAGISVYSAHTNFDEAEGGNNDYLASLLELKNGEFSREMSFHEACEYVKERLNLTGIKTVGDRDTIIKKVGLCAGSGSDKIKEAIAAGCDLFITGDIKYHDARYAKEAEVCMIDAGHYGTEKFFAENLAAKLADAVEGKLEIIRSEADSEPFRAL